MTMISDLLRFTFEYKGFIFTQIVSAVIIYVLVKYRFKTPSENLVLSKSTVKKLISTFEPFPIIEADMLKEVPIKEVKYNFCSYDIFNLSKKFKNEIKESIRKYGIGTCGPRGFYGTLDIHLDLEKSICKVYKKEAAIIYSNHYSCVQSVISCFCKPKNTVYFHSKTSEAIIRGVYSSKAASVSFEDLKDLKSKLSKSIPDKYVVVEKFGKNTGEILNIEELIKLKLEFGFRIILDETFSMPFMYQQIDSGYEDIDIIVGSLCHGYPSNGGFSCGSIEVVEYQRLSGVGYVFSASLPAFLTQAALCFTSLKIGYSKINEKLKVVKENIKGIVSDEKSPIVLVKVSNLQEAKDQLRANGYLVGINRDFLRLNINENVSDETIKEVSKIVNKYV